jgi:uncharacterized phage-associated protein
MAIKFKLHPQKAVEVAAMFLKLYEQPMHHLGLLKLLYMADRSSLGKLGTPVTGDFYVSMPYGPVLSGVYDLIKHRDIPEISEALTIWTEYVSPIQNHKVRLLSDPGTDELCENDEDIIHEVYSKRGRLDRFELVEITHQFPEWQDPHGSSIPIKVEDILKHVGKKPKEIEAIQRDAEHELYLDRILSYA